MNDKVTVFVEIEKLSNIKYEYDKDKKELVIDRILDLPFVYPYAYGFIPNTLADDNDELDALIITNKDLKNNINYTAYIIGTLVMEDEKGMDEKILCVLEEDCEEIQDIDDLSESVKNSIHDFFSNYKKKTIGRWSRVIGFINKELSIKLYEKSIIKKHQD